MKKITVRILSFAAAFMILLSMAVPVSANAKKPEFMLALGDSITTGYGLDDYITDGDPYTCASYANLVANALGLEARESYINKAVNGATSADMLKSLPEIENYIGYSDLIIVTIGGNDLLGSISIVASAIAGKTVSGLGASIDVLAAATPEKFAALATNEAYQKKIGAVLDKYEKNIGEIAEIIKKNAPEARVILLKQYNPMKNVLGFGDFGNYADTLIASVNASMEKVGAANGFEVLDVPSVIDINAAGLTNMLNYDIHPNAAGHVEIARLLASHLGISLDPSENTAEPETEPETTKEETTVVVELTRPAEPETEHETEAQLEAPGCFSSVSSAAIIVAVCTGFVLKKKSF